MTAHEQEQHNRSTRAFAAMRRTLAAISDTHTLYCDTPQQYSDMKDQLQQLHIRHTEVTCHLTDGRDALGFRISTNAFIFLATIGLVNAN